MNIQDLRKIRAELQTVVGCWEDKAKVWERIRAKRLSGEDPDTWYTVQHCSSIAASYRVCLSNISETRQMIDELIAKLERELGAVQTALVTLQNWARPESELTPGIAPGVAQMDEDTQRDFERWVDAT